MTRQDSRRDGQKGAVAVVVALSLLALMLVVGGAIDVSRAMYLREKLQQAVDAATLATARERIPKKHSTEAEIKAYLTPIAQGHFDANFRPGSASVTVRPITLTHNDAADTLEIAVSAAMPSFVQQLIDVPAIPLNTSARVERAQSGPLELVLALDYTWSMMETVGGERKIDGLKTAATSLVNTIMASNDASVGIVPFASWINVGTAYNGQSWLIVPPTTTRTSCGSTCSTSADICYPDGLPTHCVVCYTDCSKTVTVTYKFGGCVGMRPAGYQDNQNDPSVPYQGSNMSCVPLQILDLTKASDNGNKGLAAVTKRISTLNPIYHGYTSQTFIPGGLMWGWNMLTSAQPLDRASDAATARARGIRKVLVLMTDGRNSAVIDAAGINFSYPADVTATDTLTAKLCDNIKSEGISIFTVGLAVTDDAKSLLSDCASSPEYYFDAADGAALADAFNDIGQSLRMLRLVK